MHLYNSEMYSCFSHQSYQNELTCCLVVQNFNVFTLIVFVKSNRKKNHELLVFWYCDRFCNCQVLMFGGVIWDAKLTWQGRMTCQSNFGGWSMFGLLRWCWYVLRVHFGHDLHMPNHTWGIFLPRHSYVNLPKGTFGDKCTLGIVWYTITVTKMFDKKQNFIIPVTVVIF